MTGAYRFRGCETGYRNAHILRCRTFLNEPVRVFLAHIEHFFQNLFATCAFIHMGTANPLRHSSPQKTDSTERL